MLRARRHRDRPDRAARHREEDRRHADHPREREREPLDPAPPPVGGHGETHDHRQDERGRERIRLHHELLVDHDRGSPALEHAVPREIEPDHRQHDPAGDVRVERAPECARRAQHVRHQEVEPEQLDVRDEHVQRRALIDRPQDGERRPQDQRRDGGADDGGADRLTPEERVKEPPGNDGDADELRRHTAGERRKLLEREEKEEERGAGGRREHDRDAHRRNDQRHPEPLVDRERDRPRQQ